MTRALENGQIGSALLVYRRGDSNDYNVAFADDQRVGGDLQRGYFHLFASQLTRSVEAISQLRDPPFRHIESHYVLKFLCEGVGERQTYVAKTHDAKTRLH